jgi:trimeric autotransporter adhesin
MSPPQGVSNAQSTTATPSRIANDNVRPSDTQSARTLIGQATDRTTGALDTAKLATMVVDAAKQNPAAASSAYGAIRRELGAQNIGDLNRFERDLTTAAQSNAGNGAGAGMGVTAAGVVLDRAGTDAMRRGASQIADGTRILTQNPILTIRWETTTSAWTGQGGLHPNLADRLRAGGIEIVSPTNNPPLGSAARAKASAKDWRAT